MACNIPLASGSNGNKAIACACLRDHNRACRCLPVRAACARRRFAVVQHTPLRCRTAVPLGCPDATAALTAAGTCPCHARRVRTCRGGSHYLYRTPLHFCCRPDVTHTARASSALRPHGRRPAVRMAWPLWRLRAATLQAYLQARQHTRGCI